MFQTSDLSFRARIQVNYYEEFKRAYERKHGTIDAFALDQIQKAFCRYLLEGTRPQWCS